MSFIAGLAEWGLRTFFPQYADPVEKGIRIEQKVAALDGGKLFEHVAAIFKAEGIDVSTMLSDAPDLMNAKDISVALNRLVLEPAGNAPLAALDILDQSNGRFAQTLLTFQRAKELTRLDGRYGPETIGALQKALAVK